MRSFLLAVAALLLVGTYLPARANAPTPAPNAEGWTFTVRPYLWNAAIEGSIDSGGGGSREGGEFGGDYQFFALENLDGVAMVALEAARGPWRLHLDGLHMAYEDHFQTGEGRLQSTLRLDGEIVEAAAEHALADLPVHLLAGARWQRLRTAFEVNDHDRKDEVSWTDPFLGVGYRTQWATAWTLVARGDIGGFTLGSQFAYQVEAELGYAFTTWLQGTLGYRHLDVEYRTDGYTLDLTLTGWLLGLGASF